MHILSWILLVILGSNYDTHPFFFHLYSPVFRGSLRYRTYYRHRACELSPSQVREWVGTDRAFVNYWRVPLEGGSSFGDHRNITLRCLWTLPCWVKWRKSEKSMEITYVWCYRSYLYRFWICHHIACISTLYLVPIMKKYIFLIFLVLNISSIFALPSTCMILKDDPRTADQILTACWAGTIWVWPNFDSNDKEGVRGRIESIASVAISFWALLAVGALVWSGIQYTKAYGEDEKLKKAKTTAIYSIIGLILLMASFGLIDIFMKFLYKVSAG